MNDDTQTDEADEAQTDAALDENSESGSSSMTKVGVDDAQQAVTGAGAAADADGTELTVRVRKMWKHQKI